MRRWALRGVAAIAVMAATGVIAVRVPAVQDALFVRGVESRLPAIDSPLLADDALRAVICGSSSPLPDPARARSCVAVIAGGHIYVVDTGPGSATRLNGFGIPMDRMRAVFLTHFHSDHIGDLGEMNFDSWAAGRSVPLQVYGGPGVNDVVNGFDLAYHADHEYRTAHHTEAVMPHEAGNMEPHEIDMPGAQTDAFDRVAAPLHFGDLTVTAIEVDHHPSIPAYAYRFDYKGRSVVVSGDTRYHPPLARASKDADVLIHEAQSQHLVGLLHDVMLAHGRDRIAHMLNDIHSYHTDTLDAARIANQAGVKLVVFTHFTPPLVNGLVERAYFQGVPSVRDGRWEIARDGMLITLPLGAPDVTVGQVD